MTYVHEVIDARDTADIVGGLPQSMLVVGGGQMGVGIAHLFATHGSTVTICEPGDRADTLHRLRTGLDRAAERGAVGEPAETVAARVTVVADVGELSDDRTIGLAVEAVPEDLELKLRILQEIESVVPADSVIATNTSSLPVTDMGVAMSDPTRLVGMHFFNPVPASALVEIVRHDTARDSVVDTARAWVTTLGKEPVVVRDFPGFATSRLGVMLGLEAIRMLEEGVADAESIDKAMELGYRHPMGPLRSTDLVGLDIRLAVARHLHATLGDRFAPPATLVDKVAHGELGRKSGRGFYDWR